MFNLKVSPATAEALFGRMPACSEFLVACDPTEPLHSDAPVGARHFNGAFVVGYVRTGEPNTADKVCVEVIGEGHEFWFPRSSVTKIVGVNSVSANGRATAA